MGQITGATNTQKTVMLSLAEGWMLRYVDLHGWCLFMPNRSRPFARVKKRTVDEMTAKGWLTPGITTKGLGYRPAKELTGLGRKYAQRLLGKDWANGEGWDPFDQRETRKGPKAVPEKSSISIELNMRPVSPLRSSESVEQAEREAAAMEALSQPNGHVSETNADVQDTAASDMDGDISSDSNISTGDHAPAGAIPLSEPHERDDNQPRFRLVA